MNRESSPARVWRRAAMFGLFALGSAVTFCTQSAQAAPEIFYILVTDPPGKLDAIEGATGTVTAYTPGPTAPIDDVALRTADDATRLIWAIAHRQGGGNPAALYTFSGVIGSATATLVTNTLSGPLATVAVNALAWDPTNTTMGAGASNTGSAYTLTPTGASAAVGTYDAAGNNIAAAVSAAHVGTVFNSFTVTTEGDMVFIGNTLYATLHVDGDAPGGSSDVSETWLATVNTTTGAATLIGRTNDGTANIPIDGLALNVGSTNVLWGVVAHDVYTIDIATGTLTHRYTDSALNMVGATGLTTPEPASLALFATGLAGLWAIRRRRHVV